LALNCFCGGRTGSGRDIQASAICIQAARRARASVPKPSAIITINNLVFLATADVSCLSPSLSVVFYSNRQVNVALSMNQCKRYLSHCI
jgi:hypothetical protein